MYFYINYLGFYPLIPQAQFNNEEFSFNHIHFTQMVFSFLEATSTLICCFFNNINFIIYSLLSLYFFYDFFKIIYWRYKWALMI